MEPYPYPYALSQPQKSEDQIYTSPYTVASSIQTSEGGGYILQPSAQQTPNFEKSNMDSQLVIQKFEELSSCYYPQGILLSGSISLWGTTNIIVFQDRSCQSHKNSKTSHISKASKTLILSLAPGMASAT